MSRSIDEVLKAREEQKFTESTQTPLSALSGVASGCDKPAQPHPREILLRDLADEEQRLLEKLHILRQIREEYLFINRAEGERLLKIVNLSARLR